MLCSRERLENIARSTARTIEDLAEVPGLRRWQIEVMGVLAIMYFALTYPQSLIINRLFEKYRVRE